MLRPANYSLGYCLNSVLNVKALVGAFNQEKVPGGAFSVIVKTDCCLWIVCGTPDSCDAHAGLCRWSAGCGTGGWPTCPTPPPSSVRRAGGGWRLHWTARVIIDVCRCMFYTLLLCYGTWCLWDKPWLWDIRHCWY